MRNDEDGMQQHFDLIGVILLSTVLSAVRAYGTYHRDWCGVRLLPSVLLQNSAPIAVIVLIYFKLLHMLDLPILDRYLERYSVLAYLLVALFAEFITHRLLRPEAPLLKADRHQKLPAFPIIRRITKKKQSIADKIEKHQDPRKILEEAIYLSDLSRSAKTSLKKSLSHPPTRGQIINVINKVGLAHIKLLV